jgi:hypothetical protein
VPERQSHDYIGHGRTTLFAALNAASGKVIGECRARHTAADYLAFLMLVDKKNPKGMPLHLIVDNVSSHNPKEVKAYLQRDSGRLVIHYTPTHASWLNLIERWFAEVATKQVRRASWTSVAHRGEPQVKLIGVTHRGPWPNWCGRQTDSTAAL